MPITNQEHIQHDPRTKQQIKDSLYLALYRPITEQFEKRLKDIAVKNAVMGRLGHASFTYKGVPYNCDTTSPPRKANRLAVALYHEMDTYLQDLKELNEKEVPYVIGYINSILNATNHLCDYYKLLPDVLHPPIKSLIDTCPCKGNALTEQQVELLQKSNQQALAKMRERMLINLII